MSHQRSRGRVFSRFARLLTFIFGILLGIFLTAARPVHVTLCAELREVTTLRSQVYRTARVQSGDIVGAVVADAMLNISPTDGRIKNPQHRASPDGVLYLIPVNHGYLDFALNLLCSMQRVNVTNYIFAAMDATVFSELRRMGVPVYMDDAMALSSSAASKWGDGVFNQIVLAKLNIVQNIFQKHKNLRVVLTDADIVFVRNPTPYLNWAADMTFSIGSCHQRVLDPEAFVLENVKANTGFYTAKPSNTLTLLLNRSLTYAADANGAVDDQTVLNHVLVENYGREFSNAPYNIGFYDGCSFINGCNYFKNRCAGSKNPLVLVHANFLVGKEKKVDALKKSGLWDAQCISTYTWHL